MKKQILDYLHYNVWANQQLVDYLQKLPDEKLSQEIMNSFPSIRLTLLHNIGAEYIWMERLQGKIPISFLTDNYEGSNTEMFDLMMKTSKDFALNIENEPEPFFEKIFTYKTMAYGDTSQMAYDMVHHCMNHSTYHRGQVTMMLRQLGHTDPPHLDFMLYKILGSSKLV
jgi:uncharacterized damage-inducible protein DinB